MFGPDLDRQSPRAQEPYELAHIGMSQRKETDPWLAGGRKGREQPRKGLYPDVAEATGHRHEVGRRDLACGRGPQLLRLEVGGKGLLEQADPARVGERVVGDIEPENARSRARQAPLGKEFAIGCDTGLERPEADRGRVATVKVLQDQFVVEKRGVDAIAAAQIGNRDRTRSARSRQGLHAATEDSLRMSRRLILERPQRREVRHRILLVVDRGERGFWGDVCLRGLI